MQRVGRGIDVETYIKNHHHRYYCECVVYPDGTIEDASPSHTLKLMAITGLSKEKLNIIIPMEANPVAWLVDYTRCCSLWYDQGYYPNRMTKAQKITIMKLQNNAIISNNFKGVKLKEKHICERNRRLRDGTATEKDLAELYK